MLTDVCGHCNDKLVVDDFGAGYSDRERVSLLRPHLVKLDMSLIREVDRDVTRQRYLQRIVEHCHDLGARAFIAKPFNTLELVTKAATWVARSQYALKN